MTKQNNKKGLHPRNPHNANYDFEALINSEKSLKEYVFLNKYDNKSIDFANPNAVISLNKALLSHFYNIKNWQLPKDTLCPPIPGRADYIHYIADLLASVNKNKIPKGNNIKGLDIGIGANCIYPIIGSSVYSWTFVGSDISEFSINSAESIVQSNELLRNNIECRIQTNPDDIFKNIICCEDKFDFTICNPPFHKSQEEANAGTKRKITNLTKKTNSKKVLNFGGKANELWCKGGEIEFLKNMIDQSADFSKNCFWFTSLVSKKENLPTIYKFLKKIKALNVKTIEMQHGQKVSRIIAWTFLSQEEQKQWVEKRY